MVQDIEQRTYRGRHGDVIWHADGVLLKKLKMKFLVNLKKINFLKDFTKINFITVCTCCNITKCRSMSDAKNLGNRSSITVNNGPSYCLPNSLVRVAMKCTNTLTLAASSAYFMLSTGFLLIM